MKTLTLTQLARVNSLELETLAMLFEAAAAHLEDRISITVVPDSLANAIEAKAERYRANSNLYLAAICIQEGRESDANLHLNESLRCQAYAEMLSARYHANNNLHLEDAYAQEDLESAEVLRRQAYAEMFNQRNAH